jgi:sporulation protein YlmC with PRC-barrel domain
MPKETKNKISDLIPDDRNFNVGSEFGNSLIEKSLRKFGAGRSILIDKNNKIIAGNKTVENSAAIGLENVKIIESDGTEIIAVKRIDIDLNTKRGREMALADNASAKANITWDFENINLEFDTQECKDWGVIDFTEDTEPESEQKDLSDQLKETFEVIITCKDEKHQEQVYNKMIADGFKVRILTL